MPGTTKFTPRPTLADGLLSVAGGWRLKRYVMTVQGNEKVPPDLCAAAVDRAEEVLSAVREGHGVGFLLIHRATPADFVLIDWWEGKVDLRQRYFRAEHGRPEDLQELPRGAVGCVWELDVLLHERTAWITNVLDAPVPDYGAYLTDVYRYPR